MNKINKMIKGLLLTSLICLVIGGGVAIAGVSLGGMLKDASITIGDWNLLQPWSESGFNKIEWTDEYF